MLKADAERAAHNRRRQAIHHELYWNGSRTQAPGC